MPHSDALIDLYSRVTLCNRRCAGVENDPAAGIMGRGFYCPREVSRVEILLVSKNPGISDPRENAIYAPLDARARPCTRGFRSVGVHWNEYHHYVTVSREHSCVGLRHSRRSRRSRFCDVSPPVRSKHRLPVGKLYHPSWSNMRGGVTRYVAEELPRIREQYLCAVAT